MLDKYIGVTEEIKTHENLSKGKYELLDNDVILDNCMIDAMIGGDNFDKIRQAMRKKEIHENLKIHANQVTGKLHEIEEEKR